mmetsp:Transcript_26782/g.78609  ORF Transcript_26782/g.78609 Transcript_26782/m.78609 type:complete len:792 (-) Transcript_26782:20-2395(-)
MGGHVADPPTEVITDAGPGSAGLGKASPQRPDAFVRAAQLRREVVALARLNPSVAFGWSIGLIGPHHQPLEDAARVAAPLPPIQPWPCASRSSSSSNTSRGIKKGRRSSAPKLDRGAADAFGELLFDRTPSTFEALHGSHAARGRKRPIGSDSLDSLPRAEIEDLDVTLLCTPDLDVLMSDQLPPDLALPPKVLDQQPRGSPVQPHVPPRLPLHAPLEPPPAVETDSSSSASEPSPAASTSAFASFATSSPSAAAASASAALDAAAVAAARTAVRVAVEEALQRVEQGGWLKNLGRLVTPATAPSLQLLLTARRDLRLVGLRAALALAPDDGGAALETAMKPLLNALLHGSLCGLVKGSDGLLEWDAGEQLWMALRTVELRHPRFAPSPSFAALDLRAEIRAQSENYFSDVALGGLLKAHSQAAAPLRGYVAPTTRVSQIAVGAPAAGAVYPVAGEGLRFVRGMWVGAVGLSDEAGGVRPAEELVAAGDALRRRQMQVAQLRPLPRQAARDGGRTSRVEAAGAEPLADHRPARHLRRHRRRARRLRPLCRLLPARVRRGRRHHRRAHRGGVAPARRRPRRRRLPLAVHRAARRRPTAAPLISAQRVRHLGGDGPRAHRLRHQQARAGGAPGAVRLLPAGRAAGAAGGRLPSLLPLHARHLAPPARAARARRDSPRRARPGHACGNDTRARGGGVGRRARRAALAEAGAARAAAAAGGAGPRHPRPCGRPERRGGECRQDLDPGGAVRRVQVAARVVLPGEHDSRLAGVIESFHSGSTRLRFAPVGVGRCSK